MHYYKTGMGCQCSTIELAWDANAVLLNWAWDDNAVLLNWAWYALLQYRAVMGTIAAQSGLVANAM